MKAIEVTRRPDIGKLLASRNLLNAAADVGVATGRTAMESLRWGFRKLYLVDVWARVGGVDLDEVEVTAEGEAVFVECMETLRGFRPPGAPPELVVLRGLSHQMAAAVDDESLDFVHVDACHLYPAVIRDHDAWWPKLRSGVGAILAGHDYSDPNLGVGRATDEFAARHGLEVHVIPGAGPTDATFWIEKP